MKARLFLAPALGCALACGNTLYVTYDGRATDSCIGDPYGDTCHSSSSSSSGTVAVGHASAKLFMPEGAAYDTHAAASDSDHLYVTALGTRTDLAPVARFYVYDRVGAGVTLTSRVDLAVTDGAMRPSAVSVVGNDAYVLAAGMITHVVRDGTTFAWAKQEQLAAPDACRVQASAARVVAAQSDGNVLAYDTSLNGAEVLARVSMSASFGACPVLAVSDGRVAVGTDAEVLVVDSNGDAATPTYRHFADLTPKNPHNVALVGDRVVISRVTSASTSPAVAVYDVSGAGFVPVVDISAALAAHLPRVTSCTSGVCQLRASGNGLIVAGSKDVVAISLTATGAVSAISVSSVVGAPLAFDDGGVWVVPVLPAPQLPGLAVRRYDVGADNGIRPSSAVLLPNPVKPSLLYDTVFVAVLDDNLYATSGDAVARYASDGTNWRAAAVTFPQPGAAIDKLTVASDGTRELYASVRTEAGARRVMRGVPSASADIWTWTEIGTCGGGDWAALHTRVVCFGEEPGLVRVLDTTDSGIVERAATTRDVKGQRPRVLLTRDRIVISAATGGGEVLSIDDDGRLGVVDRFLLDRTISDEALISATVAHVAANNGVYQLDLGSAKTTWIDSTHDIGNDVILVPGGPRFDGVSFSNKYSTFGPIGDAFIGTHYDAVRGTTWAAITDGQVLSVYTLQP